MKEHKIENQRKLKTGSVGELWEIVNLVERWEIWNLGGPGGAYPGEPLGARSVAWYLRLTENPFKLRSVRGFI